MKIVVLVSSRFLHALSLSLWLGGIIAIGAFAAPTAFHAARALPQLAGHPDLQNQFAGAVVGNTFRKFNVLCYACSVLMILADLVLLAGATGFRRKSTLATAGLSLVLLGSALYLGLIMFPALDQAQQLHHMRLFDSLHLLYVNISYGQMAVLLVIALIVAIRDSVLLLKVP
jgi:hypothetical protein